MNRIFLSTIFVGLLATGAALATEASEKWVTKIAVAEDDGSGADPVYVELSGDELGFELKDMQIGESRSVVDSAGQNVLITRTEDGYDFAVDGRTVSMPAMDGYVEHVEIVDVSEGSFDVEVTSDQVHFFGAGAGGIMIVTTDPVDANTQAGIRSLLQAAGHTDEVTFIDKSTVHEAHNDGGVSGHKIKIVKKEVSANQ